MLIDEMFFVYINLQDFNLDIFGPFHLHVKNDG